jgi:site-specific DNA recombinase
MNTLDYGCSMTAIENRRAIGIVRVSQPGTRKGEKFVSPEEQRATIEQFCVEHGWQLLTVHDEIHVSGDAPLEDRPGLLPAVMAVQTGKAEVIVAAYADRLWWSHEVRAQVLRLVEREGGQVWSVDAGCLSNGTPTDDFHGEMRTSADRFSRRQNAHKSRVAVVAAIERGAWPAPQVPLGYERGDDGRLVVDPLTAPLVPDAFALRATGATIGEVRAMLSRRGEDASYAKVGRLLGQRAVLGEIHFGELVNLEAHPAIVDRDLFNAVQRVRVPAGRRTKSERILARLGVLRCGSCGGLMSASTGHRGTTAIYRCGAHAGDPCPRRVTISAPMVEGVVIDAVQAVLADDVGRASAAENARIAAAETAAAQDALDTAIAAFGTADVMGEASTARRLAQLRASRDDAQAREDRLGGTSADLTVTVADWELLTIEERRALIRSVVASAEVRPGRGGVDRVTVNLNGQ